MTARRASDKVAFCTNREEVVSPEEEVLLVLPPAIAALLLMLSSGVASDLKFPSRSSHITTE